MGDDVCPRCGSVRGVLIQSIEAEEPTRVCLDRGCEAQPGEPAMSFDLGPALLAAVGINAPQCVSLALIANAGGVPVLRVDSLVLKAQVPAIASLLEMAARTGGVKVEQREVPPASCSGQGLGVSIDSPGEGLSVLCSCDAPTSADPLR